MNRINYITTLLFTISALSSFAQVQLTLEDCRTYGLEHSKQIKESKQQTSAAEFNEKAFKKDLLPTLNFGANYEFWQNPLLLDFENDDFSYSHEGSQHRYNANLALMQNVYSGGLARNYSELAKKQTEISVQNQDYITDFVLFNIENEYWDCVLHREYIELSESYEKAILSFVGVIKNKVDEGVSGRNDLLLVEIRHNEAKLFVLKAKDKYVISLMRLNRAIGFPIDSATVVIESLGANRDVAENNSLPSIFTNRPEVITQQKFVELQETQLRITRGKYMPSLQVGILPFFSQPNYNLSNNGGLYNTTVMASISMPIVQWGKKYNQLNQQSYFIEAEKTMLEDVKAQVSLEVQTAAYALEEAINRVELTKNSKLKAEDNLQVITDRYDEGLASVLEVLDAQVYWQSAYKDMLEAERYYQYALTSYKKSIGII